MNPSFEVKNGINTTSDSHLNHKYEVQNDAERDLLITGKRIKQGFICYHKGDNEIYKLKTYPNVGLLSGVVWEPLSGVVVDDAYIPVSLGGSFVNSPINIRTTASGIKIVGVDSGFLELYWDSSTGTQGDPGLFLFKDDTFIAAFTYDNESINNNLEIWHNQSGKIIFGSNEETELLVAHTDVANGGVTIKGNVRLQNNGILSFNQYNFLGYIENYGAGNITSFMHISSTGTHHFMDDNGDLADVHVGRIIGDGEELTNVVKLSGGNSIADLQIYTHRIEQNLVGSCTFFGYNSGVDNTTGIQNVGFGNLALPSIVSGSQNVGVGNNALQQLVTKSFNVGVGSQALSSINSDFNTGIGYNALGKLTTTGYNTGIGAYAGAYIISEAPYTSNLLSLQSVFIGAKTKSKEAGCINEIVIGYNAEGNGSNTVTLGNDDIIATFLKGDVVIGSTSPISPEIILSSINGGDLGKASIYSYCDVGHKVGIIIGAENGVSGVIEPAITIIDHDNKVVIHEGLDVNKLITSEATPSEIEAASEWAVITKAYKQTGLYNYNHSGGSQSISANTATIIDNDASGSLGIDFPVTGVSQTYNGTTNRIDLSELKLGDRVGLRTSLTVTTSTNNTSVEVRGVFGSGMGQYSIEIASREYKLSGTQLTINAHDIVGMLYQDTIDSPAYIEILTDKACTIQNDGLLIDVTKY